MTTLDAILMAIYASYYNVVGGVNAFVNSGSFMHTFLGMVNTLINKIAQFSFVNSEILK